MIIWTYLILNAVTNASSSEKLFEIPQPKNTIHKLPHIKLIPEDSAHIKVPTSNTVQHTLKNVSPIPIGLFVSQPSNIQELVHKPTLVDLNHPDIEPRYARNFGFVSIPKKRAYRGVNLENLALFSKAEAPKKWRKKLNDDFPVPSGSDKYLTPEFYKLKSEIEKETDRTHIRGLKMSKDAMYSPTRMFEKSNKKFGSKGFGKKLTNPLTQETLVNPYTYDEGESYDDRSGTNYVQPVSYQQYSSIPSEPYHPPSTPSSVNYYDPPSSDYSFSNFPTPDPEPYYPPRSEYEARSKPYSYSSEPHFNDHPSSYHNAPISSMNYQQEYQPHYPISSRRPKFGREENEDAHPADEEESDKDYQPPDYGSESPERKPHRNRNYETNDYGSDPDERNVRSRNGGRPRDYDGYGDPENPTVKNQDDEEDDFDSNYEVPDPFQDDKDENTDTDDSFEEAAPKPKGRLQQPSRKHVKRLEGKPSNHHRKRCVKKQKEMYVDDIGSGNYDEDPRKEMNCLVCENLETGGTYETCSYESEPKKNSYYVGNASSYKKGNNGPYNYRTRRQTVTVINSSEPLRRIVRRSYNEDSYGSYTSDVEDFGPEYFTDDENEEQQEEEDDELEEYKPELPAYANEDVCKKIIKNGLTCMVCHNPETNGKYKQCSYETEPDKNSYAYAQSSSYGNDDVPYNDRYRRNLRLQNENATLENTSEKSKNRTVQNANATTNATANSTANAATTKIPVGLKRLRDIEQMKIEAVNDNFKKLIRMKKEQPDSLALADIENPSYEEQFLSLFPELSGGRAGEPRRGSSSLLKDFDDGAGSSLLKDLNDEGKGKLKIGGSSLMKELDDDHSLLSEPTNDAFIPGFSSKNKLGGHFKKLSKNSLLGRDDDDEDSEMSKMMKEFKTKDRSACKKSIKDKMTCYLCDDSDGIKREECMYVVESEPTKVTYQETKEVKTPEEKQETKKISRKREVYRKPPHQTYKYKYISPLEIKLKDQPVSGTVMKKTSLFPDNSPKYRSFDSPAGYSKTQIHSEKTYSLKGLPSSIIRRRLPKVSLEDLETRGSRKREVHRRGKTKARRDEDSNLEDPEENGEYQAIEQTPEADPSSPEGAFSEDTEPMYSPELKITLPRYMLEKNEHEKAIDDFMSKM